MKLSKSMCVTILALVAMVYSSSQAFIQPESVWFNNKTPYNLTLEYYTNGPEKIFTKPSLMSGKIKPESIKSHVDNAYLFGIWSGVKNGETVEIRTTVTIPESSHGPEQTLYLYQEVTGAFVGVHDAYRYTVRTPKGHDQWHTDDHETHTLNVSRGGEEFTITYEKTDNGLTYTLSSKE